MRAPPLVGREPELRVLRDLVERGRTRGGALLLCGEAGAGKSCLLAAAADHAREQGTRTLATTGVQAESHLPYAGLHQLLRPVLSAAQALPAPQRDALQSAFGRLEAATPNPYLVGLAALELLGDVAAAGPLLLVVDDAQWLDASSAEVLAFVARRVDVEPIVVLAALRDGMASSLARAGAAELAVGPLDDTASESLLDRHAPRLPPAMRRQVLHLAGGNALALVELPASIESMLGHGTLPRTGVALPVRLERSFAARVADLPSPSRTALLVAAANDSDDIGETLHAASALAGHRLTVTVLGPATAADLVDVEQSTLRFRHPLVRSAIYQAADIADRLAVHAALAELLEADPDRRTWHRAAALISPDEDVAAELDQAAQRAQRRGAATTAMVALQRSARLTAGEQLRGRRLLGAAELAFGVGRSDLGFLLLEESAPLDLAPLQRLQLSWLREWFGDPSWSGAQKVRLFCDLLGRMAGEGDVEQALHALLAVALRCWWSNPDQATRDLLVNTVESLGLTEEHPGVVAVLAYADPVRRGAATLHRLARLRPEVWDDPADALNVGTAATGVGAFDRAGPFLQVAVDQLRARGTLGLLAQALVARALIDFFGGRWDAALAETHEAQRLARETSQPLWAASAQLAEALVAGGQG